MIEKDLGFVLKRHNFRETSLITTLYTANFGKIYGICKGFYTLKKEFSSPLNIFSLNEFVFYPKKSEIWLISHADLISDYSFLSTSLTKAKVAGLFFNLIDKTMQLWGKNEYIFALINYCLNSLSQENETKVLYLFLVKFLTFSGFKPELNHCIICRALLRQENLFSISKGGFVCRECGVTTEDIRKISKEASRSLSYIQDADFNLALRLNISNNCEEEFFYILKEFIAYHLEIDLDVYAFSLRR